MTINVERPLPFPMPDQEQAVALQIVSDYLTLVGTQSASLLLGRPRIDGETALLAELSNCMLSGAALCAGLVEVASRQDDWRYLK